MKKKLFPYVLTFIAITIIAIVPSMAHENRMQKNEYPEFKHEKFAVQVPSFEKVVRVTATGVNIRKQPNAQSPRLIAVPDYECMDCPLDLVWTSRAPKKNEEVIYADELYVAPLLGESGDWFQINISNVRGNSLKTSAYVMKKFCKVLEVRPLTLPVPDDIDMDVAMVKSGKYAGLCFLYSFDGMEGEASLELGKYLNGMFVFPYSICVVMSDDNSIKFTDYEYPCLSIGKSAFYSSSEEKMNLEILTSNTRIIDYLMNNLDKMQSYSTTVYYGVEEDDGWHSMDITNE